MEYYFAESPLEIEHLGKLKALTFKQQEDLRFEIHKFLSSMALAGLDKSEHGKAAASIAVHVGGLSFFDQATAILSSPMLLATAVKFMLGSADGAAAVSLKIKPPMLKDIARHIYSSYGLELVPGGEAEESKENPPNAAGSTEG